MGLSLARLVAVWLALSLARGAEELPREGRTRNHGHNVCSTWGDFHYKTFDGDVFRFPGLCDYNFASDCREAYKEFAVHLKRSAGRDGESPQVKYILLTIKDDTIYLTRQLAVVNGAMVSTPHYSPGLLIEKNEAYTKVYSRAGLTLMWNREDSVMLELDSKFRNHTCGLCGDYNGLQSYSEFLSDGVLFSPIEFGNMQKINKPEVDCEDPEELQAPTGCSKHRAECERLLTAAAFEDCQGLVPLELYVRACAEDRCRRPADATDSCLCSTLSEFSRQCSHAGGRPQNWRTPSLCSKSCPGNMVYLESGSPCMDTCSHLEVSSLCEEHRMDGCFCPEGTVYDDVAGGGCVPVSQCHCKLHGRLYAPGQQINNDCEQCVCNAGRWACEERPCPGTCSLEGGAHITTFDGKKFTFHGDCYYVLAKGEHNDSYALLGELAPCGATDKQTCLKTVLLLADKRKNVVAFKSDGSVLLNEQEVNLPHVTASFSIFRPSSYHLIVNTAFGVRLQIQLAPVMQLFLTLDQAAQGQVQGLCGNFNGLEGDDFKTAGGLVEATGAGFANTWKAQSSCHDKLDWLDDPCSLSIESANYAEHWCSLLKKEETPFGSCHSAVDPTEYYKRCKYDTCNCQNNEDCLCAALSSYARACTTKGVMLWGWRERVCNKDVGACPNSQIFLYNLTTCQQTCRSLAEPDRHCLRGFAPVDGCGCPDHTFLDEKGRCVPLAKCSCYHHGLYLEAGDVVLRQEERCVCRNARLQCVQVQLIDQSCTAPKILVDCNNLTALATQNPRPVSCQTLAASYYQTECISGCVCPEGLIDDGRGGCVKEDKCPCVHNKDLYSPGAKVKVDCNTCTCQRGRWTCTQAVCHGTCAIYGSGHYITFDGKYYDFDGHCSYVAVQDYCGQDSSLGSFSVITENVPCGTTGVTCSKAIKIFLGRTELKLEDKHRVVIQRDVGHRVSYTTREVGQYLVVEASIGVIVIWDKKTTVFIKLAPRYKGAVCGLCGNFDHRSNNDFTTRDHMVVENQLDFGNSWKEAPTCPDVSSTPEPCSANPHRRSWAEKQCSLLKSSVFSACHSKVDPKPFYEACVHDSCSCDSGGDCECFCSAVASYAQECTKEQACVFWRTPDLCRCYPRCPKGRPIYDEDLRKCVTRNECGCYIGDNRYQPGSSVPTEDVCQSWVGRLAAGHGVHVCGSPKARHLQALGEVVYNGTHGGLCYYVNCSVDCKLEFFNWSCPSTPSPTPSPTTPSTSTLSTPSTPSTPTSTPTTASSSPTPSKPPGCPDLVPPREENETWWLCDCTQATCKHDKTVEIFQVPCKPPPMPTCSNQLSPVRVPDPDGCCWHWECDCYCTGWGDPHFRTFDGLYYNYQGNCTYVLVEEVTPTVDSFGVYIDNYHCDTNDKVSCPRTIIVRHETQEVLVKTIQMMPMKMQVQINKQVVALPYKKYGLQVYESGINYVVDIPELGALISYNGLSFSIRLPYRLFGNNTKGQCGTCTNDTADDCVLPSGETVDNCELAADSWMVNDPSKPHCPHSSFTTRRPSVSSPVSTRSPCTPSPLCELIKDSLFAQCHRLVPPDHYYEACVFDSCWVPGAGLECASLQTYASLCAQEKACVDWRNHTHGACPVVCPSHREYQACGPAEEPSCKSSLQQQNSTLLVEGCFCPEGKVSYSPGFDVCVDMCGCVGPDDVPRKFGEHFEFNCNDCVCLEGGRGIICQPRRCSQQPPAKCTEDGTYAVMELNPADPCCNITSCKCNASLCHTKAPQCSLGFELKTKIVPDRCCPVYSCEPKGVCVLENAEYQPGSPVYSSKCKSCVCTEAVDNSTQLNVISCTQVPCVSTCDPGFELVAAPPGECCKKCAQTQCVFSQPGGHQIILKPGDMKKNPQNNCSFFSCVKIHDQLISSISNITCPDFNPSLCVPGTITIMSNGCCKTCIPLNETSLPCTTVAMQKEISQAGCTATVTMNYCWGSCRTFSIYSAEAQTLGHQCSCCQEQQTSQREVTLHCPTGGSLQHSYTHIESCRCQDSACGLERQKRSFPGLTGRPGLQPFRPRGL
ncbi:mucin-2 [Choloepus didactylus]|uniref:mucin-2 n=1 Tax=Choloepus didactylus TaxID=27675 RepID=UPI00189D76E3|nr:mucin-2 [Choloepus didactylus]